MSAMIDPFQSAPDSALYVPRRASERAATEFERGLFQTLEAVVVLVGPPGIGKSVVLAEVARRLEGRCTCVTVEFAGMPLPELCKWVLRELEAVESGGDASGPGSPIGRLRSWMKRGPTRERDPEGALVQRALHLERSGRSLVVLIDDADEMDWRTAAALANLAGRAQGALFIGIASCDDRLLASAGKRSVAVTISDPMTHEETARYITSRLERSGASRELRARLDRDCVARLHTYSQGNPRRVHGEISLIQIELESARRRAAGLPLEPPPAARAPVFAPPAPARAPIPIRPEERTPLRAETQAPARVEAPPPISTPKSAVAEAPPAPSEVPPLLPPEPPPLRVVAAPSALDSETPELASPGDTAHEASGKSSGLIWMLGVAVLAAGVGWLLGATLDTERGARDASTEESAPAEPASAGASASTGAPEVTVTININADPWAKIWVDDRELGETPLANVPLTRGEHRFRALLQDGRIVERTVDVDQERRFISFP